MFEQKYRYLNVCLCVWDSHSWTGPDQYATALFPKLSNQAENMS